MARSCRLTEMLHSYEYRWCIDSCVLSHLYGPAHATPCCAVSNVQEIWIVGFGNRVVALSFLVGSIGEVPHLGFDIPDKVGAAAAGRKDDGELGAHDESEAEGALRLARRSWPQPEGRAGDRGDDGNAVIWIAQEAAVGGNDGTHAASSCRTCRSLYVDDLIEWNLDFDVADPKSKCALASDINGSHQVVPHPCNEKEIRHSNGHDCSVRADWHRRDNQKNEQGFHNDEFDLEGE
mmetsp:Transcript_16612/g.45991  ORF Transcript_16612/g.45991 Transcript_16612/m.45991 type:complete len:235 (+) Transcript_16612:298-1002(+)